MKNLYQEIYKSFVKADFEGDEERMRQLIPLLEELSTL